MLDDAAGTPQCWRAETSIYLDVETLDSMPRIIGEKNHSSEI